jgi:hypothetical protein
MHSPVIYCVIIKISLNKNDRIPLSPAAAYEVAQTSEQFGETARGSTLGFHFAVEVESFFRIIGFERFLELLSPETA